MIRSFRDKATALVFAGGLLRGMARALAVARRKLAALDAWTTCVFRLVIVRSHYAVTGLGSIRSGSTASGASPSFDGRTAPMESRLWTTISR